MIIHAPLGDRDATLKGLTTAGFTALGVGLAAMVVLHATSGLNPVEVVISLHLYTPLGWLLPVALVLFGLGACAFAAVARQVAAPRWLSPMLLAWAGLLGLVALFPTDPPGLPEVSVISAIHRYAAFCAFSTMAFMGLAFARWARGSECPERVRKAVLVSSWIAVVALVACSTPYVAEWFGVPREPGAFGAGLLQRTTVGFELVALACVGAWLKGSVEALGLGLRPGVAGGVVPALDVAQAPSDLGDRVGAPVVADRGHLVPGVGLRDAVGADRVLGEFVPAGFLVSQRFPARELSEVESGVERERAAGGLVPGVLAAAGRDVH
ncbi:MAG TPA: DUF998 domain-containing protein [Glycomyces sp.]|nr:DUF998 domain-containing protein [Glycomyces sp.]